MSYELLTYHPMNANLSLPMRSSHYCNHSLDESLYLLSCIRRKICAVSRFFLLATVRPRGVVEDRQAAPGLAGNERER